MDPVSLKVNIDRPREEVFAYLADVANHPEFMDHFLVSWHLTREDSAGRGAGARYRQSGHFDRFGDYDLSLSELDPPHRIVAVGRGGKYNRIKTFHEWTLEPTSSGTRLEYFYETEPPLTTDRFIERITRRRGWFRRNAKRALERLQSILEENRGRGARATVGGLD